MSLIFDIDKNEANKLTISLLNAINDGIAAGHDEPSIVANIANNIPSYLKSISQLGQFKFSTGSIANVPGSVFVHQTPKVTFDGIGKTAKGNPKSIEIGDLLLLSTIKTLNGETQRRAMLLQAKMFDSLPVSQTGNDAQHELYRDWPVIKYHRSGPILNGLFRFVYGLDIYGAAKYLLLSKSLNPTGGWPNWIHSSISQSNSLTAEPTEQLSKYLCFVHETFDFILGNRGKTYDLLKPNDYKYKSQLHSSFADTHFPFYKLFRTGLTADEGWDLIINDLIKVTAPKKTRLMKNSSNDGTRGVNLSMLLNDDTSTLVKAYGDFGNDDEPPPNKQLDDDDRNRGINIIEFVLTETDERQDDEHIK
jgi:hypothetical protein